MRTLLFYILPHYVHSNLNILFFNGFNKTKTCNGMILAMTFYYSVYTVNDTGYDLLLFSTYS
jgi:hypothetical protein